MENIMSFEIEAYYAGYTWSKILTDVQIDRIRTALQKGVNVIYIGGIKFDVEEYQYNVDDDVETLLLDSFEVVDLEEYGWYRIIPSEDQDQ
jgi:hypothetical protein